MDPDLVVQDLTRSLALVGGALVVGALSIWLAGRLSRRLGFSSGWTALAQVLTPIALLYGASLYLDVSGRVADARVVSTDERISYNARPPGSWRRTYWATVAFTADGGPRQSPLWIDEPTYEALRPGAALRVRYLSWLPLIARPADQSTRAFVPWRLVAIAAAILGAIVALRPVLRRAPMLTALGGFGALVAAVVWWVFPTPWETPLAPPILTATAEVRYVRDVTHSFMSGHGRGTVPAPQPWQVVELRFVPEGRDRPVIAVDAVDMGSSPGLRAGARVSVRYSASQPREARIAGTRTWRRREWRALFEEAALVVGLLAVVLLLVRGAGAWWRRATARP